MPLSEDEQRILKQIEQQLKESDPHLAREVSEYTLYRLTFRNLRWAAFGFVGVAMLSAIRYAASLVFFLDLVPPNRRTAVTGVTETAAGTARAAASTTTGRRASDTIATILWEENGKVRD